MMRSRNLSILLEWSRQRSGGRTGDSFHSDARGPSESPNCGHKKARWRGL